MLKKIFKILGIFIGVLIIGGLVAFLLFNEKEPQGTDPQAADEMARQMLAAVNQPAWDSTRLVQWSFPGGHDYLWDKKRHFCQVKWGDNLVLLHLKSVTGKAFKNGQPVAADKNNDLVQNAWALYCNDSFWLNAVVKAFDPGTERTIVKMDDGRTGLKVQYTSGGVTPGDSYVWFLDENHLPVSYKMWVSIIPIGGVEFTWEDWETLPTGALVASLHKSAAFDLDITNIKGGDQFSNFGLNTDPFLELVQSR